MVVGGQRHVTAALPPRKKLVAYCTGGWVGPRVRLYGYGKSCPPPGLDTWTAQPGDAY